MKEKTERVLKWVICFYISLGVLIILAIVFVCFILPLLSSNGGVSTDTLDVLEKVLLWWGIILLPFLKLGEVYFLKNAKKKRMKL